MRLSAMIAGLLACTVIFLANNQEVSAQSNNNASELTSTDVLTLLDKSSLAEELASDENKSNKDKTVEYVVSKGDTLAGIAESYDVKWTRIFNKNENITNPDILNPGITIIIPTEDEQLPDRVTELQVEAPQPVETSQTENSYQPPVVSRPASAGNAYAYGYCTWYAKQRRPDLPNQMGNAYLWVSSAQAMGIPTGSTPRAGASGQSGNHVVYIEKVNGDGTVTVSDMNYAGWGVVTTRKASASSFQYIY